MNLSVGAACNVCGIGDKLLRCAKCKLTYYCTKEHQVLDWKHHKRVCNKDLQKPQSAQSDNADICKNATSDNTNQVLNHSNHTVTSQGSSEAEILTSDVVSLNSSFSYKSSEEEAKSSSAEEGASKIDNKESEMPISGESVVPSRHRLFKQFPEVTLEEMYDGSKPVPFLHNRNNLCRETTPGAIEEICRNVISDMDTYGLCVLDNFLGTERGCLVLQEVLNMYGAGIFKDGQLVTNTERQNVKTIRGDKILWVDGKEPTCPHIGQLLSQIDNIVMRANKMSCNGKLGEYNINGRTKAMVACYPGSGSHYVKHVDNPNKDGRCITAIYYLNKDWNIDTCGGLLRVFPEGWKDQVANIEPLFDRVLFFWSDRRNPHEVQPAFQTRYAITLWYFDAQEREEATRRFQREQRSTQSISK